ncbi:MAG: ketoacyl-ACP synthase III [Anaerolineae bacterium]|nr:ketoacyl-ACP synthase III [Anaerolineae bacterium]
MRSSRILSTGMYVPTTIVTNADLATRVATSDEWIYSKLGIRERRIALSSECTSDLGAAAARQAIDRWGGNAESIGLIIVATATPDRIAPSTACIVQRKLGFFSSFAFDIAAVCSGFLFGMATAAQFVSTGVVDYALVIGADTFSRITDWTRRDCVFFGDGAGAVILGPGRPDEGFLSYSLHSDGRGQDAFTVRGGGSERPASLETIQMGQHYFEMNGAEVYRNGIEKVPATILESLSKVGLTCNDIDWIIPHQPSIRILQDSAQLLGVPFSKFCTSMERYANTSGGTIPIVLNESFEEGKFKPGDILAFAAIGSGWTWGSIIYRWV